MAKFANANGLGVASRRLVSLPIGTQLNWLDGTAFGKTTEARTVAHLGVVDAKAGQRLVPMQTGKPYADGIERTTLVVAIGGTESDAPDPVSAEHDASFDAAVAAVEAAR